MNLKKIICALDFVCLVGLTTSQIWKIFHQETNTAPTDVFQLSLQANDVITATLRRYNRLHDLKILLFDSTQDILISNDDKKRLAISSASGT